MNIRNLNEFAEMIGLELEIHERDPIYHPGHDRFYALFNRAEVKDGSILIGTFGNGHTREEAVSNYAKQISGKLLVVDAYRSTRREIRVPQLVGRAPLYQERVRVEERYETKEQVRKDVVVKPKPRRMIQI